MKRLVFLSLLLAAPATAQQAAPPSPDTRAWQYMLEQAMMREHSLAATALQLQGQVEDLHKQIDDLKKAQQEPAQK